MSKQTKIKRDSPNDLLTMEEAAAILGEGQEDIQIRFSSGLLTKRRASNGEVRVLRAELDRTLRIHRIVATWPPLTEHQQRVIAYNLYGIDHLGRKAGDGPSEYELAERKKAYEREEALKAARKAAEAMTACDVCNLQPETHRIRQANAVDMHDWTPGRAEKILNGKGAK